MDGAAAITTIEKRPSKAKARAKLTLARVKDAQPRATRYVLWDDALPGFGLRITPDGSKSFVVKYRRAGKQGWLTLGNASTITPDVARTLAKKALGQVAGGLDPAAIKQAERNRGITVADLCRQYLEALEAGEVITRRGQAKSPTTIVTDRSRINAHILPLLGKRYVREVTPEIVQRLVTDIAAGKTAQIREQGRGRDITGGKGAASRTLALVGGIFTWAIERKLATINPTDGVKGYQGRVVERFLSDDEYRRFGAAIAKAERAGTNPNAIAAVTLIVLTGLRKTEALALRWDQVDFAYACLRLPKTKSGQRVIRLNRHALALLTKQRTMRVAGNPYVFPGAIKGRHFVGLPKIYAAIVADAKLDGHFRIHDARHSVASAAINAGIDLAVIGKMLGHASIRSTARYAHLADKILAKAVDQVGQGIDGGLKGKVVKLPRRRA